MKSLDRSAIDRTGRERPGLYIETELDLYSMTTEKYIADHDGGGYRERVRDLQEDDWIPCIVAAHLAGVSKQAISDRVKRGTLEAREAHRKSWWRGEGGKVVLVRYGDAMKKKKAGRPQGSASRKRSRNSSGTNLPTRHSKGLVWECPWCGLKNDPNKRTRTDQPDCYCDGCDLFYNCLTRLPTAEYAAMFAPGFKDKYRAKKPLTANAVDIPALAKVWIDLSKNKKHKGVIFPKDLLAASGLKMTLEEFGLIYDQVNDYIYDK